MLRLFKKYIAIVFICIFFSIYLIPYFSFTVGNIFFGDVKVLYNLRFAQFLYKRSVSPLLPFSIPHYAHHQLSRTYFIQGDLYTALKEAKRELELYPEDTATYYIMGLTYGYMNQEDKAIESFSHYIQTHPQTWAGRNDKAWLQFRIGDIDGAILTISPVVEIQQNNVWVQNTYCALMINKKRYVEAKIACENAKKVIDTMKKDEWGIAYPGNDPRIYEQGLEATKKSIEENLKIIKTKYS